VGVDGDLCRGRHYERIAVRRSFGDRIDADVAAGAAAVIDYDRLLKSR
jgi:hypothetical protein